MDLMTQLEDIAKRFHGVNIQCRRGGTGWPQSWRIQLIANKNERSDYRLECFGNTAKEALQNLINEIDSKKIEI